MERLPEGSEAAGLVSSVLHSTDEIPAQEGQATNLDEKYAGCAIYRAGDRAYVEDYGGFYLVFAREAEDLGGAAEEIQRALGVEGAQLLLVRQEDAGRLAVFAAGEEVGACLLPSGEDADFAPRPGAGEAAALRLAAFDVLVCGDGGLVRAEREDASGLARVEGSAGAEGPTVFAFPGAADGEAVYRFYDEAGEREDLRLTVLAEDAAAAADSLVLSAERIEGGAVAWQKGGPERGGAGLPGADLCALAPALGRVGGPGRGADRADRSRLPAPAGRRRGLRVPAERGDPRASARRAGPVHPHDGGGLRTAARLGGRGGEPRGLARGEPVLRPGGGRALRARRGRGGAGRTARGRPRRGRARPERRSPRWRRPTASRPRNWRASAPRSSSMRRRAGPLSSAGRMDRAPSWTRTSSRTRRRSSPGRRRSRCWRATWTATAGRTAWPGTSPPAGAAR